MDNTMNKEFDYEYWSALWEQDPEAFEIERKRFIEGFIASVPDTKRQRLQGLQWRVDMERQRSKTPYGALLRLQKMMWESVVGEKGLLDSLRGIAGSQVTTESEIDPPEEKSKGIVVQLNQTQKEE